MNKKDYPELAKLWDYKRNDKAGLHFEDITPHCGKKAWWICGKGHEWEAAIDHVSSGTRCPFCSNKKVLPGYNDLATLNPQLMKEWNYEKMDDRKPSDFMPNSNKKAWWVCDKGHEWEALICDRNRGNGCPICGGKVVLPGYNDLATVNPRLAEEWNYEKNETMKPTDIVGGSHKKVWWICDKGHEWEASINNRHIKGSGCPYCSGRLAISGYTDLATLNPRLASEWNYEKNVGLKPQNITLNCNSKVWWKCKNGHEWQASVSNRNKGRNCPVCRNKKILTGVNDLVTKSPQLASEWNYAKNKRLRPQEFAPNSGKKVWWKCSKGHEWEATIASRNSGRECPVCYRSLHISFPEKVLFFYLSQAFPDAVENYKAPWLEKKELDIYIPSKKTGVEFDGAWYHKDVEKDMVKDDLCNAQGASLIRIREKGLSQEGLKSAIFTLPEDLNGDIKRLTPGLEFLEKRLGVKLDINLSRDYDEIRSMVVSHDLENCIAKTHPELLDEWDYEKNGQVGNTPENVSFGANIAIWWKCKNGHNYRTTINNKTSSHTSCPYCTNRKVLKGFNDLTTVKPEIAKEWDYEKNGTLKPEDVLSGSYKKVWWKCSGCGKEWKTAPCLRKNTKCKSCNQNHTNVNLVNGVNDLGTLRPEIAKMWNREKNGDLSPKDVTIGSGKKVWWRCKNGHEWEANVCSVVGKNSRCPYCSGRKAIPGQTDLVTLNSELASEWNYKKNGELSPQDFTPGSGKRVWWKCKNGHEWGSVINSRNTGVGCPYCAGRKVLKGFNDLATTHPNLLDEWDYEKNKDITPFNVSFGSEKRVWWRCKNGHEWVAMVGDRTRGRSCPYCAGRKIIKNNKKGKK